MTVGPGTLLTPTLRLESELGHGAMGAVWVATNTSLGAQVAVKVLRDSGQWRERFEREAKGLAQIDSPHVVKIFDFGVTADGEPFIVMELLKGCDLRAHIERSGTLSLAQTERVVRQICHALAAAHARGIVHRDIKPANVFLTDVGGDIFVKVLDFGVAKFLGADLGMTASGVLMGTPYYASPEQLMTPKAVDHRADLWSVAVVAYACLTGTLPFVADTLAALAVKITGADFAPPSSIRAELPRSIDAWMQRALRRRADERFASAAELSHAFLAAIQAPSQPHSQTEPQQELPLKTVLLEPTTSSPLAQSTLTPFAGPNAAQPAPLRPNRLAVVISAMAGAVLCAALGVFLVVRQSDDTPAAASTPAPPVETAPTDPLPKVSATAEPAPSLVTATASATVAPPPPPRQPTRPPPAAPPPPPPQPTSTNPFGTRR